MSRVYLGTKASAMRGYLLDSGTVEKLSESGSLDELINRLRTTAYSDVLSSLAPPITARRLELALRARLAELHYSLMSTASKYALLELYYMRHIAWDLKSALKSKALGKSYEESMEYLDMKAEELVGRRDLIVRVLSAKDITEAVSLLSGTEFYRDIERALSSFSTRGEVRFFDLYIDHAVLARIAKEYAVHKKLYSKSSGVDVAGAGEMVANDIDSYNVLSVLRSKLWGLTEQESRDLVVTPTSRVSSTVLNKMVASESTVEAAKQMESLYPVATQSAQSDEQLIDMIEDAFTNEMKEIAERAFVWQGLGLASALAFVKLLEFEVSNLAAVAIGVEAGMDPKLILSKLRL